MCPLCINIKSHSIQRLQWERVRKTPFFSGRHIKTCSSDNIGNTLISPPKCDAI